MPETEPRHPGTPARLACVQAEIGVRTGEPVDDLDALVRLAEAEVSRALTPAPSANFWAGRLRILPPPIVSFLRSAARTDHVRETVLWAAEEDLLAEVPDEQRDVAAIEALWHRTCSAGRTPTTLRWLRGIRDQVVRSYHGGSAYQHARFDGMPPYLTNWRPKRGVLVVDDAGRTVPSIGYAPFMEQTAPLLLRYVYETWRRRWLTETRASRAKTKPGVWDVFAGSGTGHDLLAGLLGCCVISTDLTPCNEAVLTLDVRGFGRIYEHGGVSLEQLKARLQGSENPVVRRPDIVLLDPPSRGRPTPSELYVSQWPARDLAQLSRDEWIAVVVNIVKVALQRIDPLGVVSLLVRAGTRDNQRVVPDPSLVHDVKEALGKNVETVEEVRIEYRNRVRQASLGTQRVPSTHLLLGRPS